MKIAIGADEAGFSLKEIIREHLESGLHDVSDLGVYNTEPVLYPDIALVVAKLVASGKCERGILICGTGIGMAITANKVRGIRAAQCHDVYSAERAELSNAAQIITMGSRVIGPELAKKITDTWLGLTFQDGRSTSKINRITEIEEAILLGEKN